MHNVYVLQSSDGKLYKGMTRDLTRRLREPKSGKTITTRKMKDLRVVYSETLYSFTEARKRELYLKSAAGRRFLKNILAQLVPARTAEHRSVGRGAFD